MPKRASNMSRAACGQGCLMPYCVSSGKASTTILHLMYRRSVHSSSSTYSGSNQTPSFTCVCVSVCGVVAGYGSLPSGNYFYPPLLLYCAHRAEEAYVIVFTYMCLFFFSGPYMDFRKDNHHPLPHHEHFCIMIMVLLYSSS